VVGEEDRFRIAERGRDDAAFVGCHRDAGPFSEMRAAVKPHAGVWPAAGKRLEIFVDKHHAPRRRFVEAVAEPERPEGARFVGPCSHLPRETGFWPSAARIRQAMAKTSCFIS
jgi:hypothetical protein